MASRRDEFKAGLNSALPLQAIEREHQTMFNRCAEMFNVNSLTKILFVISGGAFIAGCAGAPPVSLSNRGQNQTSFGTPDNTGGESNVPACLTLGSEQSFPIQTDVVRGANVVFVLDDSGSMDGEIADVSSRMNAFITGLEQITDQLKLILIFSMTGINGSAFPSGAPNPFQSVITQGKALYVPEAVGSRFADGAIFKSFGLSDFAQRLPSSVPLDAGGSLASNCVGAGKYFRPRHNQDGMSLGQVTSACINLGGSPRSSRTGNPNQPFSGPLGYLTTGVSTNVVVFSDDDLNVNGSFSTGGNGLELVKNTFDDVFSPLGAPAYYHSVVGLTPGGEIVNVGTEHRALAAASGGSEDDLAAPNYDDVLNRLKLKIQFSEQVVTLSCQADTSSLQVYLDGVQLTSSDYQFNSTTREIRLLPSVFGPEDEGQTMTLRVVFGS